VLGLQNPLAEADLVIAGTHRHDGLPQDGSAVDVDVDEVHGGSVHLDARLQRPPVGMQPRERRQQRRVDVDEPTGVAPHETGRQDAHVAGQHDPVDGFGLQAIPEFPILGAAVEGAVQG
jgi:hypothetical protein